MGRIATTYYNLAVANHNLAKEWHPVKNGDLSPAKVTPKTNKKVWWKCNQGHEWEAQIRNRYLGAAYYPSPINKGCLYEIN
jgi:hypothetical protein